MFIQTHMPDDLPFSFMDENHDRCVEFAKATGMQTLLVGWENVYEGEDYSTEAYANGIGKTALTLECGYHKGDAAGTIAWNAIMNGMQFLDMIEAPSNTHTTKRDIYRFVDKVIAKDGDHFAQNWQHLSPVQKGDIIYYTGDKTPVHANQDGYILIPNHDATTGMELYYFGVDEDQ